MVKNLSVQQTRGRSPGLGRSHTPRSSQARAHSGWACAPGPGRRGCCGLSSREPPLCNGRPREKPAPHGGRAAPTGLTWRRGHAARRTSTAKNNSEKYLSKEGRNTLYFQRERDLICPVLSSPMATTQAQAPASPATHPHRCQSLTSRLVSPSLGSPTGAGEPF